MVATSLGNVFDPHDILYMIVRSFVRPRVVLVVNVVCIDCFRVMGRLNATDMLERLRGRRMVLVGDSLNRNMWESLVCILRNSVKDNKKVFEVSGRQQFRSQGEYSFIFQVSKHVG